MPLHEAVETISAQSQISLILSLYSQGSSKFAFGES